MTAVIPDLLFHGKGRDGKRHLLRWLPAGVFAQQFIMHFPVSALFRKSSLEMLAGISELQTKDNSSSVNATATTTACGRRAATSDWRNPKKRSRDLHAGQAGISSFLGWSLLLWDYQPPPLEYALHGKQHAKRRAAHWTARLLCSLGYLYQPRVTSWILEEANSKGQTVFHS